ncbi:hypothetical protein BZG36_02115 [Bifiguratus adelaidae]|uniref:UV-stimulated scaffold protein A C-terminal domain-containing protein n=1 Tax=Bifiguratus adelaidae TaxID=1938954 RepID=A0A261Y322_9FUNG|nr:hypothetical protein BZG36_02115 [Bifiguratus adelaidae]
MSNRAHVDITVRENLRRLVEEITTKGLYHLDDAVLKDIKRECKKSDDNVACAYELIMAQLEKPHAQIRYSTLQLISELFARSHYFRQLLTADFPHVLSLVIGIQRKSLPPPEQAAGKLKELAIALVKSWYEKFGTSYKPITLGYDYLRKNIGIDFEGSVSTEIHTSRIKAEEAKEEMQRQLRIKRFERLQSEIDEEKEAVVENLESMETCFDILVPKNYSATPEVTVSQVLSGKSNADKDWPTLQDTIRDYGLGSTRYTLSLHVRPDAVPEGAKETSENTVVYDELRERYSVLVKKHRALVQDWLERATKSESDEKGTHEATVKGLIDLRNAVEAAKLKAEGLGVTVIERKTSAGSLDDQVDDSLFGSDESDEDLEFEDVKHDYEKCKRITKPIVSTSDRSLPSSRKIFPLAFEPHMKEDVTYNAHRPLHHLTNQLKAAKGKAPVYENQEAEAKTPTEASPAPNDQSETSTSGQVQDSDDATDGNSRSVTPESRTKLLKRAPVVEWGEDLNYWDREHVQFNTSGLEVHHRFLGSGEGLDEVPQETLEKMRMRAIYYTAKPLETLPACRAPLRNGTLCPRRDLRTCPFHGKIIPRDDLGRPLNPNDVDEAERHVGVDERGYPLRRKQGSELEHIASGPASKDNFSAVANASANEPALWEVLEADVMGALGLPVIDTKKRKGKRKMGGDNSALVDLHKKPNTAKARLQKRVNDPNMKRLVDEDKAWESRMQFRDRKATAW